MSDYRIVVGWSGGITSAWCGYWALMNYPADKVVFLFHDTKEEDEDTYRFSREMAAKLGHPVTERSDGRSVTQLFYDENTIASDRRAFCSRILKREQRIKYFEQLRGNGIDDLTLVLGFGTNEPMRVSKAVADGLENGHKVLFPCIAHRMTKQQVADWCLRLKINPPRMYKWSEHANCVGCVRGGKQYWYRVLMNAPEVYEQRAALEREFGSTYINGTSLDELKREGVTLRRRRDSITVGTCECGD